MKRRDFFKYSAIASVAAVFTPQKLIPAPISKEPVLPPGQYDRANHTQDRLIVLKDTKAALSGEDLELEVEFTGPFPLIWSSIFDKRMVSSYIPSLYYDSISGQLRITIRPMSTTEQVGPYKKGDELIIFSNNFTENSNPTYSHYEEIPTKNHKNT